MERRVSVLSRTMAVDGDRMLEWARAFAPCMAVAKANRGQVGSPEFDLLLNLCEVPV